MKRKKQKLKAETITVGGCKFQVVNLSNVDLRLSWAFSTIPLLIALVENLSMNIDLQKKRAINSIIEDTKETLNEMISD